MSISVDIKFNRPNKIYFENESISGLLQIHCPTESKHDGITVMLDGTVNLMMGTKSVGIFDTFSNTIKPLQLLNSTLQLAPAGKLLQGFNELAFEFPLKCIKEPKTLYETYHGIFINVNYMIKCDIKRSFLAKSVQKAQQFVIQYKPSDSIPASEVNFSISPETLQKTLKERIAIPRFLITGNLDTVNCCVTKPLTGSLTIQHTEVAVKSIELQLIRVETCGCAEGYSKDATEIQTIQLAEGNVCPKLQIPIYMIFPRLFTCPTLDTKNFKIEFKLNLFVIFQDDYIVTESFPITLHRFVN